MRFFRSARALPHHPKSSPPAAAAGTGGFSWPVALLLSLLAQGWLLLSLLLLGYVCDGGAAGVAGLAWSLGLCAALLGFSADAWRRAPAGPQLRLRELALAAAALIATLGGLVGALQALEQMALLPLRLGISPRQLDLLLLFLERGGLATRFWSPPVLALGWLLLWAVAVVGSALAYAGGGRDGFTLRLSRYVVARQLRGSGDRLPATTAVVAVVGIALGVAALVSVTAVMSGYQREVEEKILQTNAHLMVQKYGLDFAEYEARRADIAALPGIASVAPYAFAEALLTAGGAGRSILLKGILPKALPSAVALQGEAAQQPLSALLPAPSVRASDALPGVLLGKELARSLDLQVGDAVLVTLPLRLVDGVQSGPLRMAFRMVGSFASGMYEFDSRLLYVHLQDAQLLLGLGDTVTGLEVRLQPGVGLNAITARIYQAVGGYPYHLLDWRRLNSSIFAALHLQKIVMFLVLTLIIVVASFNIASTLFMLVRQKGLDIAILRTLGCSKQVILKIFMLQGVGLGLGGTALGLLLGVGIAQLLGRLDVAIAPDVYMVDALRVQFYPEEILLIVLAAFGISVLATLLPALRASEQPPALAVRVDE